MSAEGQFSVSVDSIPLSLPGGPITLSAGGQNDLVRKIIEEFCPRFTPGATPLYVGDTARKFAYIDEPGLARLGFSVDLHGKIPDVVVSHTEKGWLVLIEAVTSHGPINPKRQEELRRLFKTAARGSVFHERSHYFLVPSYFVIWTSTRAPVAQVGTVDSRSGVPSGGRG